MVSLIIWLILGFLAGFIAKMILPGADGGGVIMTTFLGIIGAVVGGFYRNIGRLPDDQFIRRISVVHCLVSFRRSSERSSY